MLRVLIILKHKEVFEFCRKHLEGGMPLLFQKLFSYVNSKYIQYSDNSGFPEEQALNLFFDILPVTFLVLMCNISILRNESMDTC